MVWNYRKLHLLRLAALPILSLFVIASSDFSRAQTEQKIRACKADPNVKAYIQEEKLISLINELKLTTDYALQTLEDASAKLNEYSKRIDREAKLVQGISGYIFQKENLVNPIKVAAEKLIDIVLPEVPGVDPNLPTLENKKFYKFSPSQLLLEATKAIDVFTPSRIADWITGTSQIIAYTKLNISSQSAAHSRYLGKQLSILRKACADAELKRTPTKPANDNSNLQIKQSDQNQDRISQRQTDVDNSRPTAPETSRQKSEKAIHGAYIASINLAFSTQELAQPLVKAMQQELGSTPYCYYLTKYNNTQSNGYPAWLVGSVWSININHVGLSYEYMTNFMKNHAGIVLTETAVPNAGNLGTIGYVQTGRIYYNGVPVYVSLTYQSCGKKCPGGHEYVVVKEAFQSLMKYYGNRDYKGLYTFAEGAICTF